MSENKCGWCRQSGHQKRKCKEFHELRARIWNETVAGRKGITTGMAASGVGNGAIIQAHTWGQKSNYLILDHTENIKYWQIFTFQKQKYSKRVLVHETLQHDHYGDMIPISVLDLNKSEAVTLRFYHRYLVDDRSRTGYEGYGSFRLLSPSNDESEVADSLYEENVIINKRLAVAEEVKNTNWNPPMLKRCLIDTSKL